MVVFLSHTRGWFLSKGLHNALVGEYRLAGKQVAGHTGIPISPSIGHLAVVVFFVLSGYLVGGAVVRAYRSYSFRWLPYLVQRLTRLWTVLIPALILGWILDEIGIHLFGRMGNIYAGPPGSDIAPHLASRLTPSVCMGNALFLQQIITTPLGSNIPLWSISYEFWFYILFPLLVAVVAFRSTPTRRVASACVLLGAAFFCGWQICGWFIVWLLGVGVALLPRTWPAMLIKPGIIGAVLLTGLTMYLELKVPVHFLNSESLDLLISDIILGAVVCIVLWGVVHDHESNHSRLYRSSAEGLSKMSYTLYLLHVPLLTFICGWLMPVWHRWPTSVSSLLRVFVIDSTVLVIAYLLYLCFERNTDKVRHWTISLGVAGKAERNRLVARAAAAVK